MIAHRLPAHVALEPVDMRLGAERPSAVVRARMVAGVEPGVSGDPEA